MSDRLKFHRLTKPVRFRRIRVFFKSVGHTYGVGIEKCKYFFNYVLYKLNILKRYTFTERVELYSPDETNQGVETAHFVGTIKSTMMDEKCVNVDYFYYLDHRGNQHRTLTLVDREEHSYFVISALVRPGLIIGGKTYMYGNVPRIVRQYRYPEIKPVPFNVSDRLPILEPETVTYDLGKLFNVQYKTYLGTDYDLDCTYATIQGALKEAQEEIRSYLETLTLADLEV